MQKEVGLLTTGSSHSLPLSEKWRQLPHSPSADDTIWWSAWKPVITRSWKQSFHPSSFNDQQQGCLGLRELTAKSEKKIFFSKSRELKWIPLEKIYFRIKRLMLGFHFVTAMGCGNKCQRAGGDFSVTLANNRKLFVASQSGIWAQRAALKMWVDNGCVTHPSNGAVTQALQSSRSCGLEEAPPPPGFCLCC